VNPLRTGDLLNSIDIFIEKNLIKVLIWIIFIAVLISGAITLGLAEEFRNYQLCFNSVKCYSEFQGLISPQIEIIKATAALLSLLILMSGAYLAIRSYLSASQVGMLGNAISHVTFFERFVASELSRRRRLTPQHVDVFAIYELMFPRNHVNQRFAHAAFTEAVDNLIAVVNESSRRYRSRKNEFKFDDHRRRLMDAFQRLHLEMSPNARIDFLETEDEAIEFIVMLCRIFATPEYKISRPLRAYR